MNALDVLKRYERAVVIVHYRPAETVAPEVYNGSPPPQNPACLLQISLFPTKISPSGKLIRLGETRGDEIMGWTRLDALEVVEILGELAADGQTITPILPRETLRFPNAADS